MNQKEGLYSSAVRHHISESKPLRRTEEMSPAEQDFHFAMNSNGHFQHIDGDWEFSNRTSTTILNEFTGQKVSFFGPSGEGDFFSGANFGQPVFAEALGQQSVLDTIRKYREINEDQAVRIAFLLGGVIRHVASQTADHEKIADAVKFAARMTKMGERKSGDAVASAIGMYIISGGSTDERREFTGGIYHMVDAIREDPVSPQRTDDLGLSQVSRLHTFLDTIYNREKQQIDITEHTEALDGFPTVGAEFHFPQDAATQYPNFWERLALLNMSQYQRGSYIQLSRVDREVIEVRMNPSSFPVTMANWDHMRVLLPELNRADFTITLNRNKDFSWDQLQDKNLLNRLRTLGMISYAGAFKGIPPTEKREEINLGAVYLGQTVKINHGKYKFSGAWYGNEGQNGQFGLYVGHGDNLPQLSYYLSMALADPTIMDGMYEILGSKVWSLQEAFTLEPSRRRAVFSILQNRIDRNERLHNATESGTHIVHDLQP